MEKPKARISGEDGNAFAVMGRAKKALKEAGYSKEYIDQYINEATKGDYDHLLRVTMDYVDDVGGDY